MSRTTAREVFAEANFHLGIVYMMKSAKGSRERMLKGLLAVAGPLEVLDELKLSRARVAAQVLRGFQDTSAAQVPRKFIELLRAQPPPQGCQLTPEDIVALVEKWVGGPPAAASPSQPR